MRKGRTCMERNEVVDQVSRYHFLVFRNLHQGQPWWLSGLALPIAQGLILETQDQIPRPAPLHGACFSLCFSICLSLSVSYE